MQRRQLSDDRGVVPGAVQGHAIAEAIPPHRGRTFGEPAVGLDRLVVTLGLRVELCASTCRIAPRIGVNEE